MEIVDNRNEIDEEQCAEKIKSFYGGEGTLHFSDDHNSYRLELDERRENISFEMLKQFLPSTTYEALCKLDEATLTSNCTREEGILRESFHNGGDIPDECKSKLFGLQKCLNNDKEESEDGQTKRKKRQD